MLGRREVSFSMFFREWSQNPGAPGEKIRKPTLRRVSISCLKRSTVPKEKAYSAYRAFVERRKNTFLENRISILIGPPGGCLANSRPIQASEKWAVWLSTGPSICFAGPLSRHSIDGSRSSVSGLQWIDSSDRGRCCKDERWQ